MPNTRPYLEPGPFLAEQIKDGDRYELLHGNPIYCHPAGRDHALHNADGAMILRSDPDVEWSGVDAGFSPEPGTLHAPDVAVTSPPDKDGWIPGVPLLAVEYAGRGQDNRALKEKIADLLAEGTRFVWVVRLTGPRCVEVHTPDKPMRRLSVKDVLEAPGVLRNPVPVRALFDPQQANEVVLRNLLQRKGYDSLEAVRIESMTDGKIEGIKEGEFHATVQSLFDVLTARGLEPDAEVRACIHNCDDLEQLRVWLRKAVIVETVADIFHA